MRARTTAPIGLGSHDCYDALGSCASARMREPIVSSVEVVLRGYLFELADGRTGARHHALLPVVVLATARNRQSTILYLAAGATFLMATQMVGGAGRRSAPGGRHDHVRYPGRSAQGGGGDRVAELTVTLAAGFPVANATDAPEAKPVSVIAIDVAPATGPALELTTVTVGRPRLPEGSSTCR